MFLYYRMNLCTTVTESDVARAKNALKASLVGQLNGNKLKHTHYPYTVYTFSLFASNLMYFAQIQLYFSTSVGICRME